MSPLLLSSMSSSTVILRSVGTLPRRSRPHHQIRTLRIGLWASYLEPGFQKEMQHRQRSLKYKYLNTINRKLSWDRQSPILSRPGVAIKGFMCSAWRGQSSGSEDNWLFGGRRKKGRQSEKNDVEDMWMHSRTRKGRAKTFTFSSTLESEPLFLHRSLRSGVYPSTVAPRANTNAADILTGINNLKYHGPLYSSRYEHDRYKSTSGIEQSEVENYMIDPITNRKVPKKMTRATESSPAETEAGGKGSAGLFKATSEDIEDRRRLASQWNTSPRHDIHDPPAQDHLKEYDASVTYGPTKLDPLNKEPKRSCPVQEGLRDYDERVSYGPACDNKPNWAEGTAQQASFQNGLNDYDQVTSYEPGAFNGETPHIQESVNDGLKEYDDSVSYEPGAFNGEVSTGQQLSQDGLEEYDNSMSYEPGAFNGEASAPQNSVKDGLKEYDDSTSYEPGAFNGEMPGNQEISSEQVSNDYDKTTSYEPGPFNGETSSIEVTTHEDGLKDYDDATSYEPGSFNGSPSEASESDNVKDGLKEYDDSTSYEAGEFNGKSESREAASNEDGLREYDEATSYEPGAFNAVKEEPVSHQNVSREDRPMYPKLARYLKDLDTIDSELHGGDRTSSLLTKNKSESEKHAKRSQLDKEFGITEEPTDMSASQLRDRMNTIDVARKADPERKLTGNFSRDFPEDFKKSWIATEDSSGTLMQKFQEKLQSVTAKLEPSGVKLPDEERYINGQVEPSEFARTLDADKQRIETSFDRIRSSSSTSGGSGGSGNAKGGATELEDQVREIYESKYGKITPEHRQSPAQSVQINLEKPSESAPVPTIEPTRYKILAYDPTMQSIDIAETSSIVPDSASPLTPAEVLLRLSNPAKFFPHFKPLQAQGYEIVSGSGDVLVFRKVHDAGAIGTKSSSPSHPDISRTTTNPIDGMQPIAATGNFASPTGFVNYDRPDPTEEPPFRSHIDVRREEDVFSGRSSWSEGSDQTSRKKMGLGKRALVGGVMVGGASYAVGVVSDFFQTGGRDGKGPQGF